LAPAGTYESAGAAERLPAAAAIAPLEVDADLEHAFLEQKAVAREVHTAFTLVDMRR